MKGNKFIKFAEFDPDDDSRLDHLFEQENHDFYINETDLYKYYQFNILKHLLLDLAEENLSAWEVFRMVYPVAVRILQDYLEISASDSFLELLDEIPEVLTESQETGNPPFFELFAITRKDNSIHTHCVNVGMYCLCLAQELGVDRKEREEICRGGLLADIGKKIHAPGTADQARSTDGTGAADHPSAPCVRQEKTARIETLFQHRAAHGGGASRKF